MRISHEKLLAQAESTNFRADVLDEFCFVHELLLIKFYLNNINTNENRVISLRKLIIACKILVKKIVMLGVSMAHGVLK